MIKNFKSNNEEFNRNKQIGEMSDIITKVCERKKIISSYSIAEKLYIKGYRKTSDVIAEFKELVKQDLLDKGLCITAVKNALDKAEKQMLGE